MSNIPVKPADGLKVRTEDGLRHIRPGGERVPPTTYYRRRIADGDLIVLSEAAIQPTATVPVEPTATVPVDTKPAKPAPKKKGT